MIGISLHRLKGHGIVRYMFFRITPYSEKTKLQVCNKSKTNVTLLYKIKSVEWDEMAEIRTSFKMN